MLPPTWSLDLVHDVAVWSLWIAPFVAAAGTLVTRDMRFAVAFAIGAAFDIGTLALLLPRARRADGDALSAARVAGPLIGARLTVKAMLLLAAVLLPALLDLWGMALGVLMVDLTLMTVGSVRAARQTFRTSRM